MNLPDVPRQTSSRPLAHAAGAALRWRGAGLVVSKLFGVLRSVILAWLLLPVDFGLFAMAVVPLDMLLSATDVGMLPALVQKARVDRRDFDVAWTVGVIRGLLVCVALVVIAPFAARLLGDARASDLIRVIALRPLIAAFSSIRLAEIERRLQFRSLAIVDLLTAAVHTIVTLLLAESLGVWAMAAGMLCGSAAGVVASYWQAPYWPTLVFDSQRADMLLRFGRWVLVGSLAATLGEGVLVATITRLAGTAELGRYALAASIALTPAAMVGSLIGAVAFVAHSRVASDELQVAKVFQSSIVAVFVLIVPAYVIMTSLAPMFVAQALDRQWEGLAPVIRILAIAGVVGLLFDCVAAMLAGVGRPRASATLGLTYATVIALSAWALTSRFGIKGSAIARLGADTATIVVALAAVRPMLRRLLRALALPAVLIAAAAASGALVTRLTVAYASVQYSLTLAGALGIMAAGLTLFTLDRWFGNGRIQRYAASIVPRRFEAT